MKRLLKKAELVQEFPIANLKNRRGQIGDQGVDTSGIRNLLVNVCGMNLPEDADMRTLVEAFKADQNAITLLQQLCQNEPINVQRLPEDYYSLQDGHHRAFLMDQAGFTTIPANVN
jgi:hypothetical protein